MNNNYRFPTLTGKEMPVINVPTEEIDRKEQLIRNTFNVFGIDLDRIDVCPGYVETSWNVYLGENVKIPYIRSVLSDMESFMKIPVSIFCPQETGEPLEIIIPNEIPQYIHINDVISTKEFQKSTLELPCALGATYKGTPFVVDLAKMPHLLIGAATGIGKSCIIQSIIASLLCKKSPKELKFVLIDPECVEFSNYEQIAESYLAKSNNVDDAIITNAPDAVSTLESLHQLMEDRYDLLREAEARNIKEYNQKVKEGELDLKKHKYLPYIVTIINEFGDLMMTAGKDFEFPLVNIAQMSRAVGIHFIIATRELTPQIVTGIIKANFPCRIACRVVCKEDSLIILDRFGAEKLLGKGNLLFSNCGEPVKFQGSWVDETTDIAPLCYQISIQTNGEGIYELPSSQERREEVKHVPYGKISVEYADSLFEDAAKFVVAQRVARISALQRNFCIGFNRAGRLMNMLAEAGIVALSKGSSPSEVLIASETALTQHIAQLKVTMAQQFITAETGKKMTVKPAYDSMLEEAACSIVEYQAPYVSFIQHKFTLGYDRANSIMDQLESLGIVSQSTEGARELLISDIDEIKKLINDSEKL